MTAEEQGSSQAGDQQQVPVQSEQDEQKDNGAEAAGAHEADAELSHDELLLTLQDAKAKADEYWNQLLRARADLSNMQRRAERELENAHKFGLEKFVRELLPVLDSLELGLAAADGDSPDPIKVKEGIELTLKLLADAAEKFGVTQVDPAGEPFNPEFHQAMSTQQTDELAPNRVLTVYQKGYLLNGRLIRPAMVVVSADQGKASGGENPQKIDETA